VSKDRDWPQDPSVLSGAKAIVFYSRPAGDIVLGDSHRTEFEKLMQAGVGYAALHWGTCAQPGGLARARPSLEASMSLNS